MDTFTEALESELPPGLYLSAVQAKALFEHWALVQSWNERVNLTAIVSDSDAARLHYADSLHVLPHLGQGSVLDVGSGAGYPGVPLAIAEPGRRVVLMEPRAKRASFLQTTRARLGLGNVEVWTTRSDAAVTERFMNVVTRATFSDPSELEALKRWAAPGGRVLAFRAEGAAATGGTAVDYSLGGETRSFAMWEMPK